MEKYAIRNFYIGGYHTDDKKEYQAFIDGNINESTKIDVCAEGYGAKELAQLLGQYAMESLHYARLENDTEDNGNITFAYEEWEEDGEVWRVVIATVRVKNNQIVIDYNEQYDIYY